MAVHGPLLGQLEGRRGRGRGPLLAFVQWSPKRRIATLEMLGTLVLVENLELIRTSSERLPIIPLLSGNQGKNYSLFDSKARKMPWAAILMELMLLLHRKGCAAALWRLLT